MHALIIALLFCANGWADSLLLEVKQQRHLSASWTKLYREKSGWRCETELTKHYYLEKEPAVLAMLPLAKGSSDSCSEKVSVFFHKKKWKGCADDPAVKEFLRTLARDCGR